MKKILYLSLFLLITGYINAPTIQAMQQEPEQKQSWFARSYLGNWLANSRFGQLIGFSSPQDPTPQKTNAKKRKGDYIRTERDDKKGNSKKRRKLENTKEQKNKEIIEISDNEDKTSENNAKFDATLAPLPEDQLLTLRPGEWLIDGIINRYMVLLAQQKKQKSPPTPKCYFFNSNVYRKFVTLGHEKVTIGEGKQADLSMFDKLIFPINPNGAHWVLVIVNIRDKNFEYFDSLGANGQSILNTIKDFIKQEQISHKCSKTWTKTIDFDTFNLISHSKNEIPQQNNTYDCGIFMCTFAKQASQDITIIFEQDDINEIRAQILREITHSKIE